MDETLPKISFPNLILGDEFVEKEICHSPSTAQIDTEVQVLLD